MQQVQDLQSSTQDKHHKKCGRLHTWLNKMLRAVYPADLWNVIISNHFKVDYIFWYTFRGNDQVFLVAEGGTVFMRLLEGIVLVSNELTVIRL